MSRTRLLLALVTAVALALGLLGPASALNELGRTYGGTPVVAVGEPDSLDPTTSSSATAVEVSTSFCERLYDFDAKGQVAPRLAAALPTISKDKLTYTIPLRKGIRFNDDT